MQKKFLTLEEVSAAYHIPPEIVTELVDAGEIKALADRGTWKYRREEVEALIRSGKLPGTIELPEAGADTIVQEFAFAESNPAIGPADFLELDEEALAGMSPVAKDRLPTEIDQPTDQSSSDVVVVPASSSDVIVAPASSSDVVVVPPGSSSDVVIVPESSSDVSVMQPPSSTSFFQALAGGDETDRENQTPVGEDSALDFNELSDSSPRVSGPTAMEVPSTEGLSDAFAVIEGSAIDGSSVLNEGDSGITLEAGDSGIALETGESGISLEGIEVVGAEDSGISVVTGDSGIALDAGGTDSGIAVAVDDSGISIVGDSGITVQASDSGISAVHAVADPNATLADDFEIPKFAAESDATIPEPMQYFDQTLDEMPSLDEDAPPRLIDRGDQTMEIPTSDDDVEATVIPSPRGRKATPVEDVEDLEISDDLEAATGEILEDEEELVEEAVDASDESFAEYSSGEEGEDLEDSYAEAAIPAAKSREPSWGMPVAIMVIGASVLMGANSWLLWEGLSTMWTGADASGPAQAIIQSVGSIGG